VLSDERIRERFTRLLGKFDDVDPWLASLVYDGSELPNHFSEGQTVLVNLAAALTVASAVIGKPGHTPGWVVLDEPTNALDSVAVERMADYLGSLGLDDLPAQMFVATFDEDFANKLVNRARKAGRRVRRISLRRFDRLAKRFDLRGDDRFLPIAHGG
jgi:DNA repair exonuclease SbcCD ATPase subunit